MKKSFFCILNLPLGKFTSSSILWMRQVIQGMAIPCITVHKSEIFKLLKYDFYSKSYLNIVKYTGKGFSQNMGFWNLFYLSCCCYAPLFFTNHKILSSNYLCHIKIYRSEALCIGNYQHKYSKYVFRNGEMSPCRFFGLTSSGG